MSYVFCRHVYYDACYYVTLQENDCSNHYVIFMIDRQPQGKDKCSVARHHQANLVVCIMCSCCTTSPYGEVCTSPYGEVCKAEGGIGSGEIFCYDIYPARPITTVSLAANTYCMMDGLSSCAPRTVGPRIQFSGACERSH